MARLTLCVLILIGGASLGAQVFPKRPPQAGFAHSLEFEWRSERGPRLPAEQRVGARLYLRAPGNAWAEAKADFDAARLAYAVRVAGAGAYEIHERFPLAGDAAPAADAPAQAKVCVDLAPPQVEILEPAPGALLVEGARPVLKFKAADDNLDPERAIDVYGAGEEGLQPLATSISNTGEFTLDLTGKAGERFTIHLVCADRAGNVGFATTTFTFANADGSSPVLPANTLRVTATPAAPVLERRKLEFRYVAENSTASSLAAVVVMFSVDDGATWEFGGKNESGGLRGGVTFELPWSQRRSPTRVFDRIRFAFVGVTAAGTTSRPPPVVGDAGDLTLAVDTAPPVVFVESPFGGEEFVGGLRFDDTRGKLLAAYSAHDANLEPAADRHGARRGPVNIYLTTKPSSPPGDPSWRLLAGGLDALGVAALALNVADSAQACLAVTAADELGNVGVARSGVFSIVGGRALIAAGGEDDLLAARAWSDAIVLQREGKLKQALARYDDALRLAPGAAALMHDKATCLVAAGRLEDAQGLLEKAVALGDRRATYRYALAVVLYKRGRDEDARTQLEAVTAQDACEPHILARMLLATIHTKAGRVKDARALWESVVKNAPAKSAEARSAAAHLAAK